MKRALAIAGILMVSVPVWLPAQTGSAPQTQKQAVLSVPQAMPGMQTPSSQTPNQPMTQLLKDATKRPPMSLKDFEDLAVANNPTLKQANDLVRRSAEQARQAGLYPNPSLGYEGAEIRGGSFGGGEQGAFVQQTIRLGGQLGLRKRVFQEQQRENEAGVTVQRYRLVSDVDQRFYSALAAQEIVNLRQTLLKITLDAVQTAHQLANIGQADLPDILQAEVEADQAKVNYKTCLLYTSPSPRDPKTSRMPSSA